MGNSSIYAIGLELLGLKAVIINWGFVGFYASATAFKLSEYITFYQEV